MQTSPLMIGGCPRSGTTALVQVLNSNLSVRISSEENLLNAVRVLEKLLGTRERRMEVFKKMGNRELSPRETLSVDILASNFTKDAVWPVIYGLYKWHHNLRHGNESLALWGDKLPNYYKDLNHVLDIQGVRYLHITRNPFDVVNSMLRRTAMAKQGKDWWKAITDIDDMIDSWINAYNAINQVKKNANVFHFHYEELVFDFEHTMSELNYFLNVDLKYQNVMIDELDKHYDRSFLNQKIIKKMLARPEIQAYFNKYSDNMDVPNVSASLKDSI